MMSFPDFFSKLKSKTSSAASRLFTPKEFKAVLLFLSIGFAVLLFRGGKQLFYTLYPPATPNEILLREQRDDSVFAALSRKVIEEDSLKFSISEDSVIRKEKIEYVSEN